MRDLQQTLVMKFGGTSVGSPEAINQVIEIVRKAKYQGDNVIIVSSALAGITNLLIQAANDAAHGKTDGLNKSMDEIHTRHMEIFSTFCQDNLEKQEVQESIENLISHFANVCQAIAIIGEASPRAMDAVASLGERMSVRIIAAALNQQGIPAQPVDASEIIVTDNRYQAAIPLLEKTNQKTNKKLSTLLAEGLVPVVTGFVGATEDGIITTLGRGGSDYSAALIGVAMSADEVLIWTDVDGVMTADPRLTPDAQSIPVITYKEVSELAYFGAKVLHPKTIRPVVEANISLRILNTFNPEHPGTLLVEETEYSDNEGIIKAVTAIKNVQLITLEGRGMLGVPGVAARIFSAVAATGATVPLITEASSEQSITFAIPCEHVNEVLESLDEAMGNEIENRNIDSVWATEPVVIVTAVCPRMRERLGVAGKIFSALAEAEVNVLAIAQGSSSVSISLVISDQDLQKTINALHILTIPQK
ncbi:MAG: aspartate kinase [Anaerolineales bacterium]|nr:aspartate kinase [Anaerolineales bacterium]